MPIIVCRSGRGEPPTTHDQVAIPGSGESGAAWVGRPWEWALAGYAVELIFGGLGLVPSPATAKIPDQGVSWDYTTWLNIVFLVLAGVLIVRFIRTGGPAMLRMMGGQPEQAAHPDMSET